VSPLTVLKISLAVAGVAVFGYGVRVDSQGARWAGVAFVAVAALLRFVRPRPRE
jgi:hypothetical protein